MSNIQKDLNDLESELSMDDDLHSDTLLQLEDSSDDSASDPDSQSNFFPIQKVSEDGLLHALTIGASPLIPVMLDLTHKPIPLIALLDAGATCSFLKTLILPKSYWLPYRQYFQIGNGTTMHIDMKSVPITFHLTPDYHITHQFLSSSVKGKDMIIGFDILQNLPDVRWNAQGLRFGNEHIKWTTIPSLCSIGEAVFTEVTNRLIHFCCANSQTEFLQKHQPPLWTRAEFFIKLPFKETAPPSSPTRASHSGMHPDHLKPAQEELKELLQQKLIEETTSS